MLDAGTFMKSLPFQVAHGQDNYNLANTTPELLKFQLQEQYRSRLRDLKDSHSDQGQLALLNTLFLEGSFNTHLQSSIDAGMPSLEAPTQASTPPSSDEDDVFADCNTPSAANYLNLKVLIENSVFDTSKINRDAVLSLLALRNLKTLIADKRDLKNYLLSRIAISQQFCLSLVLNPEHQQELDLDPQLLLKILRLNNKLQELLVALDSDLDYLTSRLNNHNMACLVLGYVEDVRLLSLGPSASPDFSSANASSPSRANRGVTSPSKAKTSPLEAANAAFDTLFAHVASVAVQRNVALPPPPSPSGSGALELRAQWALRCIDAILAVDSTLAEADSSAFDVSSDSIGTKAESSFVQDSSFLSASPHRSYKTSHDKVLSEYKTALSDLRFLHQYLSKEYEYTKESSLKLIQEYRKKSALLEKELTKLRSQSPSAVDSLAGPYDNIDAKDREISKLRKELNALKVDKMGTKIASGSHVASPRLLHASPTSSQHNLSLLTGPPGSTNSADGLEASGYLGLGVSVDDDDDSRLVSSALSTRPTSYGSSSTSNGILRKEFKKIVSDIQDQYEVELGEERLKRRQLQEQLLRLQPTEK